MRCCTDNALPVRPSLPSPDCHAHIRFFGQAAAGYTILSGDWPIAVTFLGDGVDLYFRDKQNDAASTPGGFHNHPFRFHARFV